MNLYIFYKNGTHNIFKEEEIDCSQKTIKGHAAEIIKAWQNKESVYKIDKYNAILLEDVICVRVV